MTAVKLSDKYLALVRRFPLAPIKDHEQLSEAIILMKELTKPVRLKSLTEPESDYLDVLSDLIVKYEQAHLKRLAKAMTPAEALEYLIEQSGITQSELARQAGLRQSHLSEVLSGTRAFSKDLIVKLAHFFKVSPELFLS